MGRPKVADPKVQRGLSLRRSLFERISEDAEKYGRTWNETVELVLVKAFGSSDQTMQNRRVTRHSEQGSKPPLKDIDDDE